MANNLVINETPKYSLSVVDGTNLTLTLLGPTGPTGPANVLNIGTVTTAETGVPASATITGSSPTQTLNLTLPKGNTGSTGPQGVQGVQGIAGPNTITSSTTAPSLSGYIFGNGTNIAGATAATSAGTPNTLMLRSAAGSVSINGTSGETFGLAVSSPTLYAIIADGTNNADGVWATSLSGTGVRASSSSGTGSLSQSNIGTGARSVTFSGSYHHQFGGNPGGFIGDDRSAVERVRGWFVWFFGNFVGRLKTADITANRDWTLPNASGTVALDSDIYSDSLNITFGGTYPITGRAVLTTPHRKDTLISATSGAQSMTARTGKWIDSFTYDNFSNRVMDGMTSISFPDLVGSTGSITIGGTGTNASLSCTSISFPELKVASGITTGASTVLSSLSFPKLEVITGGIGISQAPLTALDFPELKSLGGNFTFGSFLSATFASLTSLTFPKLVYANSFGLANSNSNLNIPNLTSFSAPLLAEVGAITIAGGNFGKLKTINYPALKDVASGFTLSSGGANAVNSVDLSLLENIGTLTSANLLGSANSLSSLTSISYPSLRNVGGDMAISSGLQSNAGTTSVLIGPNLKHVNGNITSSAHRLDSHIAWGAVSRYVAYLSIDIPASGFAVSNSSTAVTVTSANHGLGVGDVITITGLAGAAPSTHPANVNRAVVTAATADTFTYSATSPTSIIPTGTALLQREASVVFPTVKNGRKYIATTNGSSGSTEPTWLTTLGATVADSGVTWRCIERSYENLLSRFEALNGTNDTYRYGSNRLITFGNGQSITGIASIAATSGVVTANAHGLTTGTQIIISGGTGATLPYNGLWTITSTGVNTFTLNELSGSGWAPVAATNMTISLGSAQFSGGIKVPTSIVSSAADVHHVLSATGLANVNSFTGAALPVFVAGVYYDRGNTTNGFKRYECAENSWSIWHSTTLKRWAMTPNSVIGTDAQVSNYAYTQAGVPITTASIANPSVITTSAAHGYTGANGSRFTVLIEGNSRTEVNGLWTATYNNVTTNFTIPVNLTGVAGTGGTATVLNQQFQNGPLLSGTVAAPVQAALMTVNMASHGYSNGDFVYCSGAQSSIAANALSINNLNTSNLTNANNSEITVVDSGQFTFVRFGSTQPFIGTLSVAATTLTQMPLIRRSSNATEGFTLINKLRARGVTTSMFGMV